MTLQKRHSSITSTHLLVRSTVAHETCIGCIARKPHSTTAKRSLFSLLRLTLTPTDSNEHQNLQERSWHPQTPLHFHYLPSPSASLSPHTSTSRYSHPRYPQSLDAKKLCTLNCFAVASYVTGALSTCSSTFPPTFRSSLASTPSKQRKVVPSV